MEEAPGDREKELIQLWAEAIPKTSIKRVKVLVLAPKKMETKTAMEKSPETLTELAAPTNSVVVALAPEVASETPIEVAPEVCGLVALQAQNLAASATLASQRLTAGAILPCPVQLVSM